MPDKRTVDELSIEELERILTIRKREARQARLTRMKHTGRIIDTGSTPGAKAHPFPAQAAPDYQEAPADEIPKESVAKRKVVPQFEDAVERSEFRKRDNHARQIWHNFVDRSLLLVEVAAVIGLIALGAALANGLNLLQTETAAAQAAAEAQRRVGIPTVEPTPQLTLAHIVLPTGHTPPQNGVSSFNFDEVPPALRGQIAAQVYLPPDIARPPITDDTPLRLTIPALNIDHSIVQGVDWNALQQGIGMLPNGAVPRTDGDNVVLAAHNDIYGEIFRHLDQLQPGDRLQLQTRAGIYTYIVRETQFVAPDMVNVMDSQGAPVITLISCYPYRVNTQRIVVIAERADI